MDIQLQFLHGNSSTRYFLQRYVYRVSLHISNLKYTWHACTKVTVHVCLCMHIFLVVHRKEGTNCFGDKVIRRDFMIDTSFKSYGVIFAYQQSHLAYYKLVPLTTYFNMAFKSAEVRANVVQ